jgi:hypothetical protein
MQLTIITHSQTLAASQASLDTMVAHVPNNDHAMVKFELSFK